MKFKLLLIVLTLISQVSYADILKELASPVTTDAKYYLIAGTAATLLLVTVGQNAQDNLQANWSQNKPFGESAKFGDLSGTGAWNAAYALGMLVHYWASNQKKSLERVEYMFKTSVYSTAATYVLKYSLREPRPDNPDQRDSMPSGHASIIFSFASVVNQEHGWVWGVPAYALATFTGLSRINDNRHRLSNVVAGATIGISYGLGVFYSRKQEFFAGFQFLPTDDLSGAKISYSANF